MIRSVQCILCTFIIGLYAVTAESTLQQLHVVFRHGDRNPEQRSLYPKDPNINDKWAPDGFGQLTKHGKMQEYSIGKALRRKYDQFLGKLYTPEVIDPLSTDLNRTKMSLELVLAGLYPPAQSQIWNTLLPWQPIPYNYVSMIGDPIMGFSLFYCQKYMDMYNEAEHVDYFQDYLKSNAKLIQYINENSGLNASTYFQLFVLRDALHAEVQTGRKIPEWTIKVYPGFLDQVGNLYYELQLYNDDLKKYAGGRMLKKIIRDFTAKKDGTLSPIGRKIFLYSGHEYNVAYILGALNVFKPHIPPYGSNVAIELHKINNVYGVKIFYEDYKNPQYLTIPGCDSFCPFDQFIALTESVIPNDEDVC